MLEYVNAFQLYIDEEKKHLVMSLGQNVPKQDDDKIVESLEEVGNMILDIDTAEELAKSIQELIKNS